MSRKLHVSNLSYLVEGDELGRLFAGHGTVRSVAVECPLGTADSSGAAVVEMGSDEQGAAAIAALNGAPHRGFALVVGWAEAEPGTRVGRIRLFDLMDAPREQKGQQPSGPQQRSGFGRARPRRQG